MSPRLRPSLQATGLILAALAGGCGGSAAKDQPAAATTAPAITQQPQDTLLLGGNAGQLQVVATGSPTYQWRKGGVPLAGRTGATLPFAAAQASDEGTYDVVVANGAGSVTSAAATVTVNRLPAFTTQPANQSVTAPAPATFTLVVDGKPTPTLQWQSSADGTTWTNLAGATGASYTVASTTAGQSGTQFRCVATNLGGNTSSQPAYLLVNQPTAKVLSVNVGVGVAGTPTTGGPTTAASIPYAFAAQAGYTSLSVTLDGAAVPASGTIAMTADHVLRASAAPSSAPDTGNTVGKTPFEIQFVNAAGLTSKLSDYKGKVIFLACSEFYCDPCRSESKILQAMQDKYGPQGLVILEVVSDFGTNKVSAAQLASWAAEAGFTSVPALHDTNDVPSLYQITGFPTNFLIGRDFKIQAMQVGYSPYTVEQMIIKGLK